MAALKNMAGEPERGTYNFSLGNLPHQQHINERLTLPHSKIQESESTSKSSGLSTRGDSARVRVYQPIQPRHVPNSEVSRPGEYHHSQQSEESTEQSNSSREGNSESYSCGPETSQEVSSRDVSPSQKTARPKRKPGERGKGRGPPVYVSQTFNAFNTNVYRGREQVTAPARVPDKTAFGIIKPASEGKNAPQGTHGSRKTTRPRGKTTRKVGGKVVEVNPFDSGAPRGKTTRKVRGGMILEVDSFDSGAPSGHDLSRTPVAAQSYTHHHPDMAIPSIETDDVNQSTMARPRGKTTRQVGGKTFGVNLSASGAASGQDLSRTSVAVQSYTHYHPDMIIPPIETGDVFNQGTMAIEAPAPMYVGQSTMRVDRVASMNNGWMANDGRLMNDWQTMNAEQYMPAFRPLYPTQNDNTWAEQQIQTLLGANISIEQPVPTYLIPNTFAEQPFPTPLQTMDPLLPSPILTEEDLSLIPNTFTEQPFPKPPQTMDPLPGLTEEELIRIMDLEVEKEGEQEQTNQDPPEATIARLKPTKVTRKTKALEERLTKADQTINDLWDRNESLQGVVETYEATIARLKPTRKPTRKTKAPVPLDNSSRSLTITKFLAERSYHKLTGPEIQEELKRRDLWQTKNTGMGLMSRWAKVKLIALLHEDDAKNQETMATPPSLLPYPPPPMRAGPPGFYAPGFSPFAPPPPSMMAGPPGTYAADFAAAANTANMARYNKRGRDGVEVEVVELDEDGNEIIRAKRRRQ